MIDGYRVWQGEYRGVPIALYSCGYAKPWGQGMGWISIVLAVEETGVPGPDVYCEYSGPPIPRLVVREIAEHKYAPEEISIRSILNDPEYLNSWDIAQVRVEVKDQGGGRLGFMIDAAKKPSWATFDLEQALNGETMSGAKEIKPLVASK